MIFTVLGSCSGTEPMPGRHHTSISLETEGRVYFWDAGENCAHASYLLGIDQLNTDSIFISHTHMDHTGGLPELLWNLRKLCTLSPENEERMRGRNIRVFLPDLEVFDGVTKMLRGSEGNYETVFTLEPRLISDGPLLDADGPFLEGGLSVSAFHNFHLGAPAPGEAWKSFSFVLRAEGKKVVYSGDFRDLSELLPHLDGADLIFLETGHHRAFSLCRELLDSGVSFGKAVFFHHGVEILRDFEGELALAKQVLGDRVSFADDGTQIEL